MFYSAPATHLKIDDGRVDTVLCHDPAVEVATFDHAAVNCPDCRRACGCRACSDNEK